MTLVPSATWRMLTERQRTDPMPTGLDAIWRNVAGRVRRFMPLQSRLMREATQVLELSRAHEAKSDADLNAALAESLAIFRRARETRSDILEGLALVREAARREVGLGAYREQVAGALALLDGRVAEMATGEGKTLTAGLAATVAGWRGRGCHVVTANDYLAARDCDWLRPLYTRCGLRAQSIIGETSFVNRKAAYAADITHSTSKELAADFLRDRLELQRTGAPAAALFSGMDVEGLANRLLQRGLHTAIVDEIDSVLIDEAVTPLIISGHGGDAEQAETFRIARALADQLEPGAGFRVDHRYREVTLTDEGREALESLCAGRDGIWRNGRRREELVVQALEVREFYESGRQYVVQDGKVVIVDESTGRIMPDRSWRDGMHQAIEAREELEITPMKETMARISFQRFFRLYERLSGMTGTAREARSELWSIYGLQYVSIPTHRPVARRQLPDIDVVDASSKFEAIADEAVPVHASGRPVLIGTRTVQASERLSEILTNRGVSHRVLNAVRHQEEAEIVAEAGRAGRVTVATNMAGRGTDIKLDEESRAAGGLHVIAAERHASARIDRQLAGRAGRQGDPGSCVVYASLEDELVRRYGAPISWIAGRAPAPVCHLLMRVAGRLAQLRSGRDGASMRAGLLKRDDWLDDALGFAGPGH